MMIEAGVILIWVIGLFLSCLLLYFVIRLAVTHAIRASRSPASEIRNDHGEATSP